MLGIIAVFLCVLAIPLSVGFVSYMINRVEYNAQLDIAFAHNMPYKVWIILTCYSNFLSNKKIAAAEKWLHEHEPT